MRQINHLRIVLCIAAVMLVSVPCVLLVRHFSASEQVSTVLVPDVAPDEADGNIEKIPNDTSEKDNTATGGSVRLMYSDEVKVNLQKGDASLYFGNPGRSNQDMILQIIIQEEVIAQSDLIPAGYQLKSIELLPEAASMLQAGSYQGKFVIHYYDQEIGGLAAVNTEIPITVAVSKK